MIYFWMGFCGTRKVEEHSHTRQNLVAIHGKQPGFKVDTLHTQAHSKVLGKKPFAQLLLRPNKSRSIYIKANALSFY